ncbi:hypothetical protein FKR81_32670 [Lentzea tibetensis]|uniref:Uncharacterized protein n=1 Tax=Lentzea tibetensis TaxID=2591470 RepID=A0A563EKQ4_9PSEU|nr:hypothetical protein [Lentzea tibetensis]TWP47461.1 hypothetical protein FKR81_32670 [Lentzea tibetensis]
MRKKLIGVALAGLAAGSMAMTATASQADPTKGIPRVADAPVAAEVAAAAAQCWHTFEPSAPNGGPMRQTYRNCNSFPVSVTPAWVNGGGQISTIVNDCRTVQPGAETVWNHGATFQGVNYTVSLCYVW